MQRFITGARVRKALFYDVRALRPELEAQRIESLESPTAMLSV
ncbi:hypothetical protein [Paraburkholderia sp. BCC1886]|nr:hypothetical protein [Paraburkholderia sp. BCC1886]